MQDVRKQRMRSVNSPGILKIETGIALAPKRALVLQYRNIEARADQIYRLYAAEGISLLRAIQIAVAEHLGTPASSGWHRDSLEYARSYIPRSATADLSGKLSSAWTLQRAKSSHDIVRTLRARMRRHRSR